MLIIASPFDISMVKITDAFMYTFTVMRKFEPVTVPVCSMRYLDRETSWIGHALVKKLFETSNSLGHLLNTW